MACDRQGKAWRRTGRALGASHGARARARRRRARSIRAGRGRFERKRQSREFADHHRLAVHPGRRLRRFRSSVRAAWSCGRAGAFAGARTGGGEWVWRRAYAAKCNSGAPRSTLRSLLMIASRSGNQANPGDPSGTLRVGAGMSTRFGSSWSKWACTVLVTAYRLRHLSPAVSPEPAGDAGRPLVIRRMFYVCIPARQTYVYNSWR